MTLTQRIESIRAWTNAPIVEDPDDGVTLYRCTECGHVGFSIGSVHAHIEKHRPIWRFWQSGSPDFLEARTEVLEYDLTRRETRFGSKAMNALVEEMTDRFIEGLAAALVNSVRRTVVKRKLAEGHQHAQALAEEVDTQ